MRFLAIALLLAVPAIFSCKEDLTYKATLENPETFRSAVKQLSDVIVHDIFSPVVASRIYVYPAVGAYEVLAQSFPERAVSLDGQLTGFTAPPAPGEGVDPHLASLHAYLTIAQTLIFSEDRMEAYREEFYQRLEDEGLPGSVKSKSLEYGSAVAKHVMEWASKDNYKQTRTFPKYTIRNEANYWKPTPPGYMDGIEPSWNKIRPMVLDSANQFAPVPPLPFSMEEGTEFYTQLKEVYEVGKSLDTEQTDIAKFWDCNPYVSHRKGHAMFATKKITPGGHWMGITAIATRKAGSDYVETSEAFLRVTVALFDGFISCWDEKWRSIVVRPETLINQYLDEEWVPLLQTPPFPEYTSGHSVISRSAAITLTDFFGDNFSFEDTSEEEYGLPTRSFNSFLQASEEAALSRLYGGIHYRMAIENGVVQGENVGNFVVKSLTTRRNKTLAQND